MKGTIEVRAVDGATTRFALTKVSAESTRIHLEAAKDSSTLLLDGLLRDGMIKGSCQQGELRSSFELLRVTNAAPKLFDEYVGSYDLGSGNFISIGRAISMSIQASLGPDMRLSPDMRLGFVERLSGRRGNLTAISDTAFFAGPALGLAYPLDVQITFIKNNQGQVTGLKWKHGNAPEKSARKVKIREEEVRFRNGEITLTGDLLLPPTKGPHPVVVLVHGSTPLVRYYFGPDPYMYPVYGIAVLVYDKRGVGASTGERSESVTVLASDALAGVEYLKGRPDIDPKQIGLFGHSQGAWVVPNAASRSKDVAFVIAGAASGLTGPENVLYEIDGELRYAGFSEADRAKARALFKLGNDVVEANGEGWNKWREEIAKARNEKWFRMARTPNSLIEMNEANRPRIMEFVTRERQMFYDPVPAWEKITIPALVYESEWDSYVPARPSEAIIGQALKKSGNKDYTIKVFPKSNHGQWAMQTDGPNNDLSHRVHYDLLLNWLRNLVNVRK